MISGDFAFIPTCNFLVMLLSGASLSFASANF